MTPAARYAAAITILDSWRNEVPIEVALTRWARGARYAGSKDRAAVRDHAYDVLRRLRSCETLGDGKDGRHLILGLLRVQGVDPATVFTGEGHAPAPLSDKERTPTAASVQPQQDVPDWTLDRLASRAGANLQDLLRALQNRAPVYLRVNLRKTDIAQAQALLATDGITSQRVGDSDTALEITDGARRVRLSDAYGDGLVELQDLSVQRAVASVMWPDAGRILDFCAGGGGKSLAIAARSGADLVAHDAHPERMRDIAERAARAGVVIPQASAATLRQDDPFQAVLCDVPCSGSGTWRRDPEAKWRLTEDMLAALVQTQAEILDEAAQLVATGGQLVYMTCSLFADENEDQVRAFCQRQPDWKLVANRIDTPLTASDGFFTAVLTRNR